MVISRAGFHEKIDDPSNQTQVLRAQALCRRACLFGELLRSLPAQPERVRRPHPWTASALAVPAVVRHVSIGAGEDESGYGCAVTTPRREEERSVPAETSTVG